MFTKHLDMKIVKFYNWVKMDAVKGRQRRLFIEQKELLGRENLAAKEKRVQEREL